MTPALSTPQLSVIRQDAWLSYDEVMRLEAIARAELFNRLAAGRYQSQESGERARNGRPIKQIALTSLSTEAQARYLAGTVAPEAPVPVLPDRARGAMVPLTDDGKPDVAALIAHGRQHEVEVYQQRVEVVMNLLAAMAKSGHGQKLTALATVCGTHGIKLETARNWLKMYKKEGPVGLFPCWGATRGSYPSIPEPLQAHIKAAWRTQQRQTVAQILEHTVQPWCAVHRVKVPNYASIRRFLAMEITKAQALTFRGGKRAYEEHVMAKVHRDPRDLAVNEIWCADHRRFDLFVIAPDGAIVRPWLTAYLDIATADWVGWCISRQPDSQRVALALRAGIAQRGCPQKLYHDNGKEFVAKRFGGKKYHDYQLASPAEEMLLGLGSWPALPPAAIESAAGKAILSTYGIESVIHAIPYSSWSKPIESMFRALAGPWENLLPGYCGNAPDAKPEKLKKEMAQHRLLTLDEFIAIFSREIERWRAKPHGERFYSPREYYERAGDTLRRCTPENLDLLLIQVANKTVNDDGIELCGHKYMDMSIMLMTGEKVICYYNPDDMSHIIVRPKSNPDQRIVVAEISSASWHEVNKARELIFSGRKQQRLYFSAVGAQDRAVLNPEYVDPTGANRLAIANAQAHRALEQAETAEKPTIIGALKAAQQADNADSASRQTAAREAAATVAADILAQARRRTDFEKGA